MVRNDSDLKKNFIQEYIKEFQEFCRLKMKEDGHSGFKAWLYTRGMGRLERWK